MKWLVRFRTCSPRWAAQFPDHFNFAPVWDRIPWEYRLIERETSDERSARDQFNKLKEWAETHEQPIKDVELLCAEQAAWTPAPEPQP